MPTKDLKPQQFYMETENGERTVISGISDIIPETDVKRDDEYLESFKCSEFEITLPEDTRILVSKFLEPFRKIVEKMIQFLNRTYLCNNWRKMHGLPLIRRRVNRNGR